MTPFKILVTSQKGGVGKSTVSANLAAYLRRQGEAVTLLDFDTHGSSSTWLTRAPNIGIVIQQHALPLDQGGKRPLLDARLHLRRAASSSDIVICDLTWTDSIAGELMFEYDLVIVPTSVSEIELAATAGFLNRHSWVFDATKYPPPTLLLAPTRVHAQQLSSEVFSKQRFPISFMLAPPILESQSARDMFEQGYLMDLSDECGRSFIEFGQAVCAVREMHNRNAHQRMENDSRMGFSLRSTSSLRTLTKLESHAGPRTNAPGMPNTPSNRHSLSGEDSHTSTDNKKSGILGMGIPQFLKRMSRNSTS